jgi:hypothetical protein
MSRPSTRASLRFRKARPAAWLWAEGVKKPSIQKSSLFLYLVVKMTCGSGVSGDAVAVARSAAYEHEFANEIRALQSDVLGNHGADGETEHVDLGEAEGIDEDSGVSGHAGESWGNLTARGGDAGVVE